MHLLIPFAACQDPASRDVLRKLDLPNLRQLVQLMDSQAPVQQPPGHPNLPHEQVLARALGWSGEAPIPWAALRAGELGHATDPSARDAAWAFITPCHWQLEQAQVTVLEPELLDLSESESSALMNAMQAYFAEDGVTLVFDNATRWLARGELFRSLVCASIERAIGTDVAGWMPASAKLRRLQNEMQMLLYAHPVNDERMQKRALTVNSFWVSGCGALGNAVTGASSETPLLANALQRPALQRDWHGWGQAWAALDAHECAALLAVLKSGDASARLTLCSEDRALDFVAAPAGLWRRLTARLGRDSLGGVWKQL